jgi:glutaminyl-tRNA synthetase
VKDANGEVVELRCTYDPATRGGDAPDGRKVQGTIHWVSAPHALDATLRLYDKLFTVPQPDAEEQDILELVNPESLTIVEGAKIEPSVGTDPAGTRYQFERTAYFISDVEDSRPGALVFNRTVTLRDSWAKVQSR